MQISIRRTGRSVSFSRRAARLASNALAGPHATLSTYPVLVGSTQCAPFPWAPRPPMKPDIPTLHKPDILICSDTPTKSLDNQPTHQYHLPRMNIMLYIVRLDWRGARRKLRLLEWRF